MNSTTSAASSILSVFQQPVFVALLASAFCGLGIGFLTPNSQVQVLARTRKKPSKVVTQGAFSKNREKIIYAGLSASVVTIIVLMWTKSIFITAPFSAFGAVITWIYLRNRSLRGSAALLQVWPEVTDHLISGLHSGLSLSEALAGLGTRGPDLVRPHFLLFRQELLQSGDFVRTTENLKLRFNNSGSDQIFEAILMAKSLGGSELLQIFRTLGDFLRQDLALRKEIEIKHGWIKNSAHLSSAAPWLLLLLLSSQPGTAQAFSQPGGIMILLLGLFLTSVAYLWMGKLGQLPNPPRVFGQPRQC